MDSLKSEQNESMQTIFAIPLLWQEASASRHQRGLV